MNFSDAIVSNHNLGTRLPVLLLPDGRVVQITKRDGLEVITDEGAYDLNELRQRATSKHPIKVGEMKVSDLVLYNVKYHEAHLNEDPMASREAGPAYCLLHAGLIDSDEAQAMLGIGTVCRVDSITGQFQAMGFSPKIAAELMHLVDRRTRANRVPAMTPKPPAERKRRITYLGPPPADPPDDEI